jgi:hypothetical protein
MCWKIDDHKEEHKHFMRLLLHDITRSKFELYFKSDLLVRIDGLYNSSDETASFPQRCASRQGFRKTTEVMGEKETRPRAAPIPLCHGLWTRCDQINATSLKRPKKPVDELDCVP